MTRLAILLCALTSVIAASLPAPALASSGSGNGGGARGKPAAIAPTFPAPMAMPPSAATTLPANAQAQPSPAPSAPVSPSTAVDTWTPFSHAHRNKDGTVTTDVHVDPTYRKSNGTWTTIDPTVHATGKPAQPLAADGSLRPVRFGAARSDIVEVELDSGPVSLSSDALAVGKPNATPNSVTYGGVATDTDLRYTVNSSGVKEELMLNSSSAPTSFTFHLADPHAELGTVSRASDGGYVFSTTFAGAIGVEIAPAFAYQPVGGVRPIIPDPSSAHLSVVASGDGFDITESVDPGWLAGKSFPVILDPTLNFTDANGIYGLGAYVANGCGGCFGLTSQGAPMGMGSFAYPGGNDDEPIRSFYWYNLGAYIPQYSAVTSASFNGYVTGCFEDQPANFHCNANTYYEELHALTAGWNTGSTWTYLNSITTASPFATLTQGPFCISYQPGGCNYVPNGCGGCFWQSFGMTGTVQGWVSNPSSNNGFSAMLHEPVPYSIGGPSWDFQQSNPPPTGQHPYLSVTYDPAPGAPGTPAATPGNAQATVSWGASSTNGGSAITQYAVQAWSNGQFVSNRSACGSCTTATVTGLSNGTQYYFSVYAVDADGLRSPNSPNSNIVTPTAIQLTKSVLQTAPYTAANPQPFFSRGEVVTYQLTVTNPMRDIASTVSTLSDQLPAGLAGVGGNLLLNGSACSVCSVSNNQFSLTSPVTLAPGAADVFTYEAVALGASDRQCSIVNNAASVAASFGATASASAPITACDSGLGYENWWSYVNQDLGAGGKASVNVANGNLVVQVTDSTPVQAHGRFAYVLRRTYNSQDTSNVLSVLPPTVYALPDAVPIGAGWRLNVDQLGDGIVDGAVADGLLVPSVQGLATAAFDVTLVDEDGTYHTFTPNGLAANGIPVLGGGITPAADLLNLVPRTLLRTTSSDNVCVDETFNSPPGVHLSLWRYLEVNPTSSSAPCTPASGTTPVVMGFAAMRPDRLRFEFSGNGQLLDETDGAGVDLRYAYRFQATPTVALGNLLAVYEPGSCTATVDSTHNTVSLTPGCRALVFTYPSATETDVSDPGGRITQYLRNGSNQLVQVKNVQAASAYQYTYSTASASCGSAYGQLCSASDLNLATSNTTSPCATTGAPQHITCFAYSAPASGLGLPQVSTITDRRGYSTSVWS